MNPNVTETPISSRMQWPECIAVRGHVDLCCLSMWYVWHLFFFSWLEKYLYRSPLLHTEPTAEWNKLVPPPSLSLSVGNVGNHSLNMKYWVVVEKSTADSTAKMYLFWIKDSGTRVYSCVSQALWFHSGAAIGSLSWSGSARSIKDSAVGESERKKVGGGGSRRRGGVHRRTSEGEGTQASWGLVVGKEDDTENVDGCISLETPSSRFTLPSC